jgi:hypothetical protein
MSRRPITSNTKASETLSQVSSEGSVSKRVRSKKRVGPGPAVSRIAAIRASEAQRGTANRLAVSFETGLADQVRRAAARESRGNVSAWLAEAAREHLRLNALGEWLAELDKKHGKVSAEALAEVDRLWPR